MKLLTIALSAFVLFTSCSPTLRAYKKVATDTSVTPEKKQIITPWVNIHFPQETKYVPGKDSVLIYYDTVTDTKAIDSVKSALDSLLRNKCKDINVDSVVKAVERRCRPKTTQIVKLRVDTFYRENGPVISNLRYQLNQSEAKNASLDQKVKDLQAQLDSKKAKNRSLLIYLIIACAVALGEAYLLLKPKFM